MKAKHNVFLMAAIAVLMTMVTPVRASVTDAQIMSSVKDSYIFKTFLRGDDIKIVCKDGVVTLTGVVAGSSRKLLAETTVAAMPGVKKVDNRLTIKDEDPTANSDAWIQEKVEITLAVHRSVNDSKIDVSAKDGVITLKGVTSNQAKKELATAYAEDVDGVKSVKNEMVVNGSWKATYIDAKDYVGDAVDDTSRTAKNAINYAAYTVDDSSITAQVKYALLSHRSTSALKTKVKTFKGVVTLSGTAKNEAEKTLATLLANDINGVLAVKNLMTIE